LTPGVLVEFTMKVLNLKEAGGEWAGR